MTDEQLIENLERKYGKMKESVTVKEYAQHVGITRQGVEKAIANGRIPGKAISYEKINGKTVTLINKSVADTYWVRNANQAYGTPAAREAVERIKSELGIPDIVAETDNYENISYPEAKRREKIEKAEIARLEVLKLKGIMIDRDVTNKQLFESGQMVRDAIMAVPDRIIADIISANGNQTQIRKIMTESLASALEMLSDAYEKKYG
jgi:hypothetical protein